MKTSTSAPEIRSTPVSADMARYAMSGTTMGTRWSAAYFAAPGIDSASVQAAMQASVDRVDGQMSSWKPQSELSRFNVLPVGQWMAMPHEFAEVLAIGLGVQQQSDGAFDVGVGEVVEAWGFGPGRAIPEPGRLRALSSPARRASAESLACDWSARRLSKHAPVSLDFSGIAKGYGVDQLAGTLAELGITSYLVSIDGEVRTGGRKPDGSSWVVAIERPKSGVREIAQIVEIADLAMATSGDYRHFAEVAGELVSHTIDPRRGRPVRNRLASVTVTAPACVLADAWATALMVLGEQAGPDLARQLGIDALFIVRDTGGLSFVGVGSFEGLGPAEG